VARPPPRDEIEARGAFYDTAAELTPFLGAWTSSGVYIVTTRDKDIGRSLFAKEGRGEMHVLTRAVMTLQALHGGDAVVGKSFIDVGANIGTEAVPALLEHGFGSVLAIEPEQENFTVLRINAILNGVDDRLVALRKAASNSNGTAELVVNRERGGKHTLIAARSKNRTGDEIVHVETVTLDQLAEEDLVDPDGTGMLWIDAQAHEGHIMQGATALTSRGVPLLFEWDPRALDRTGGRAMIQEIAAREYTHFAPMRVDPARDGPKLWLRRVAELESYAERFLDPDRSEKVMDIMLLRLAEDEVPDHQVADEIDLYAVVKRHAKLAREAEDSGSLRRVARRFRNRLRRLRARPDG